MKAIMESQPIGVTHRLAAAIHLWRFYRRGIFGNAQDQIRLHEQLCQILTTHAGIEVSQACVLELGCGQMARQTALFAADGAQATGIDVEIPTYRLTPAILLRVLRENGPERAIKSLVRHVMFDRAYIRRVSALYPRPIPYQRLDTRWMSASALAFPDDHFDFVYSIWVAEHIEDVSGAVRELARVLKPSGVTAHFIHLFSSLSGGHHLEWLTPDEHPSTRVPAWDHLLEQQFPANTFLNKLRLDEFREIFAENLELLSEQTQPEGDKLLTPELFERLAGKGYNREDLLTRSVTFMCRKKQKP